MDGEGTICFPTIEGSRRELETAGALKGENQDWIRKGEVQGQCKCALMESRRAFTGCRICSFPEKSTDGWSAHLRYSRCNNAQAFLSNPCLCIQCHCNCAVVYKELPIKDTLNSQNICGLDNNYTFWYYKWIFEELRELLPSDFSDNFMNRVSI